MMWITMTIVFAILLLVCISINSDRARRDDDTYYRWLTNYFSALVRTEMEK